MLIVLPMVAVLPVVAAVALLLCHFIHPSAWLLAAHHKNEVLARAMSSDTHYFTINLVSNTDASVVLDSPGRDY